MNAVSIVVPCYNEQATVGLLLEALYAQTYPRQHLEVVIADGMSTDCTRKEIAGFKEAHPGLRVRVVDNAKRTIPAGLNRAIEATEGDYIVRLDAHASPYADYVERCVSELEAGRGDNVGGIWDIQPGEQTWQARSIAAAAAHPLGAGDARYRVGGEPQAVDTVPFGAFHRSLIERIGAFDESLLSNEDYEFNARVRKAGGTVWLNPAIRSKYFARRSFGELTRQYWRYGYWKARMLRRYPETFRWRQLSGLLVLSFFVLGILALRIPAAGWLLAIEADLYALALLAAGIQEAFRKRDLALLLGVPLAVAIMHLTWGAAFLWSLVASILRL